MVTITGSDLGGSTSVEYGGSSVPVTSISATEIEITIPSGASTNSIVVTNDLGCQTTDVFTVIDNTISGCEGTTGLTPTDLFISEVTDAPSGSHTYIEIFNGTGAAVNLDDYELRVHNNGNLNAAGDIADLTGILADGDTYVIGIGGTNAGDPEGGFTADDTFAISGINDNDNIRLYFDDGVTETWLDVWGDTNGNIFTIASAGYTYRRINTGITVPRVADWGPTDNMQNDWDAITPVNYDDIGSFDFSTGAPPTTTNPVPQSSSCDLTATFSVTGTEGLPGGMFGLEYRWFVAAPGDASFIQLSDGGPYSGANTAVLNISDTSGLEGYQYYCQVWEDTNACFTASEAVRVITQSTRWENPGSWSNGAPDINTVALIDFNYDTGSEGSFSACQLFVDASAQLIITDNTFVEVDTDVTVDGSILVRPYGSFVQIDDSGSVTVSSQNDIVVEKRTAILNSPQEYTYWSSPVNGETIDGGLNESNVQRRFLFNAQNYRDSTMEDMNDNATDAGQDDIDDNGDDWQLVTGATVMTPGVGYAATHSAAGYIGAGNSYVYTFEGPFNNGIVLSPVYRNDAEGFDNNWNFIGNPYPSAIAVDGVNGFFAQNVYNVSTNPTGALDGAIYLWSHDTAAQIDENGNEVLNYSSSDYAIINGTGEAVGGDGVLPDRFIPSGQGFFVTMSDDVADTPVTAVVGTADVEFNNAMRVTGNNSQFFRSNNLELPNKLSLNLSSDNGVFSQILIGYVEGATDAYDGSYYDASRVLSSSTNSILFSTVENSEKRLAIQGKAPGSLGLDEVIPLGFYTSISEPTLYTITIADLEGAFMSDNDVFIKDNLLDITHNLSESHYTFTSDIGEFTERFEIVFQSETLSNDENTLSSSDFKIIELANGEVKFTVGMSYSIETIEIIDHLGRTLYHLKGGSSTEVYQLNGLSQSTYLARITLSNGQVITKRAIKRH
ncbi:MAG: lamin tail domain-containing protein [Psychroserpens sp.]|nr:lamin tail domain-containing protein [Psychroserpens sp.]